MKPSELVTRFRIDVDDDEAPYLWSDAEVWDYLNDAHRMFARLTGGIRDASTTSICKLAVAPSVPWLDLSPLVLEIRSARLESTGRTLRIISFEELFGMQGKHDQFPVSTDDLELEGDIKALVIGMERNKLRAVRIPQGLDNIYLVVHRLPKDTLAPAAASAPPAAVTSLTRSGSTVTATTTAPHGKAGDIVVAIAGATQTDYNGTFAAKVTGASTFTYTLEAGLEPATPATGTITWAPAAEAEFEVDVIHHLHLLSRMKELAYLKQDADTFDKLKAQENGAQFTAYCMLVKQEEERRAKKPRLMSYGGL